MTTPNERAAEETYDESIIRPELRIEGVQIRGRDFTAERLRGIKKGLTTLHTLETMAVNIYLNQITSDGTEHNRQLIAAMCNEMTHLQDFQLKLLEYGWKPSILRFAYWTVGFVIGFTSRLRGRKAVLRAGIWTEAKAVAHYGELLETIEWDDETRWVVEKNQADEQVHIDRWRRLLDEEGA